jgi:hypothetical protein
MAFHSIKELLLVYGVLIVSHSIKELLCWFFLVCGILMVSHSMKELLLVCEVLIWSLIL